MDPRLQELLDKILGLGFIPAGWKTALAALLPTILGWLADQGAPLPDWLADAPPLLVWLWVLYVGASIVLKATRPKTPSTA